MKRYFSIICLLFIVSCSALNKDRIILKTHHIDEDDLLLNQTRHKLRVGVLVPLSGKASKIGEDLLNGAVLSYFNNSLDNIIIMPFDTKGTSFGAIEAINLAIQNGVDVILGPFFSDETKAVVNIAKEHNLLVISFSDNQSLLTDKTENLFLFGLTPRQEIYRLISYLVDYKDMYTFSALFPNDIYGSNALSIFKEVIFRKDAKIVKTDFYSKNDYMLKQKVKDILETYLYKDESLENSTNQQNNSDNNTNTTDKNKLENIISDVSGIVSPIIDKTNTNNNENSNNENNSQLDNENILYTDVLLLPDGGKELSTIGSIYTSLPNEHKPLLVGTSKWLNSNLFDNQNFEDTIFVAPNPSGYIAFDDMYYETYKEYPLRIATLAYDAITALSQAYDNASDKDQIRTALEDTPSFDGLNGKFRFLKNGFIERKLAIIRITNGKYEIINFDNNPFLNY